MRLIDADKLPYVNKAILVDDVDGDIIITIAKEYTSYVNDETPTVEAIPIEWLRMWFTKNGYLSGIALVDKIETDWRKENEINRRG